VVVVATVVVGRTSLELHGQIAERRADWEGALVVTASATRGIAALPALEDSVRAARAAMMSLARTLLAGKTAADAHLEMSRIITRDAERSGARVVTLLPTEDSVRQGGAARVTMRVDLELSFRQLMILLSSLGSASPFIGVVALDVTGSDPLGGSESERQLKVEMICIAWMLWSTDA